MTETFAKERDVIEKFLKLEKDISIKFEGIRKDMDDKHSQINRMIYIGVGIAMTVGVLAQYAFR